MKNIKERTKKFFKALHEDESAPGTVEWVLMVIVALIIMAVIYYIAQWVIEGGSDEAKNVDSERSDTNKDRDKFKKDLGL